MSNIFAAAARACREPPGRVALVFAFATVASFWVSSPARAQSPMISGWLAVNAQCKSGQSDDPKTQQACKRRDDLGAKLARRGCVYQVDGDWWRCQRGR